MNVQMLLYRAKYIVNKNSPELLLIGGISGIVVSTVLACKATLKVDSVIKESNKTFKKIEAEKKEKHSAYATEEEYKKDLTIATAQRAVAIGKLYLPSVVVGGVSVAMLVGGHRILSKRYLAVGAAYAALDRGFKEYRGRVVETEGPEKDSYYRYGIPEKTVKVTSLTDEGKEIDVEVGDSTVPSEMSIEGSSIYAKFFDESATQWQMDHSSNMFLIRSQERFANDMLRIRGHLFLNDVYDSLGIPRTREGAIVGWVWSEGKRVTFGLDNPVNQFTRDFVNGYNTQAVLLDFNVDGIIFDLL